MFVTLCALPLARLLSVFFTAANVGDNLNNIKEHFDWSMEMPSDFRRNIEKLLIRRFMDSFG